MPVLVANRDVSVVGWVDILVDRVCEGIADLSLDGIAAASDLAAALERLEPDVAIDLTLPEQHHEVTSMCLERGVAVLGEKPMAANLAEGVDLVRRSEAAGKLYAVSQNFRYNSGLVRLRNLISGLGRSYHVNAAFYRGLRAAGRHGEHLETMDSPLLFDMAIHTFDAARYIVGSEPVSVYCSEFNPPWSWYQHDACAVAEFEFSDGARFTYQGSWCALGFETSCDSSWRASCAQGSAVWDGTDAPAGSGRPGEEGSGPVITQTAVIVPIAGDRFLSKEEGGGEGFEPVLDEFVRGVRGEGVPMTECYDNLWSFAMVMAAMESSRSGRRVPVATVG